MKVKFKPLQYDDNYKKISIKTANHVDNEEEKLIRKRMESFIKQKINESKWSRDPSTQMLVPFYQELLKVKDQDQWDILFPFPLESGSPPSPDNHVDEYEINGGFKISVEDAKKIKNNVNSLFVTSIKTDVIESNKCSEFGIGCEYSKYLTTDLLEIWLFDNRTGIVLSKIKGPQYSTFEGNQYFIKAKELFDKKNYKDSIILFTKYIELNPEDPKGYFYRGCSYGESKNYQESISDFTKYIELNPENPNAYLMRGKSYFFSKNYQESISDYTKCIELNPKNGSAFNDRGYVFFDMNKYDEAIKDLKKSIELNESKPSSDSYIGLSISYYQKGDKDSSKEFYLKAINNNPIFKGSVSDWEKEGYFYTDNQKDIIGKMIKDFNR
jgi:tetratricopeptide (TPR) repeat protein